MKLDLQGVAETSLIPLWARAFETNRSNPIIQDTKSVQLLQNIDYDFSRFEKAWLSQTGISIRTIIFDEATEAFVNQHPDAVIINLGAGFDARFERMDNGEIRWYDLDLPELIEIKRHFFEETERYRFIARSVMDFSWFDEIRLAGNPTLIIAEGLLMYLDEREVKTIFEKLAFHFPNAEMLFEMLALFALGLSEYHDSVSQIRSSNVEFKWTMGNSKELESWSEKIKFIEEWNVLDYFGYRWGWLIFLNAFFKRMAGDRIVHLRFQ